MKKILSALKHSSYRNMLFYGGVTVFAFYQMNKYGTAFTNSIISEQIISLLEEYQPGLGNEFVKFVLNKK